MPFDKRVKKFKFDRGVEPKKSPFEKKRGELPFAVVGFFNLRLQKKVSEFIVVLF